MGTLHPWKRRIFIDTEFTNLVDPRLISLALVAEDGAEFYGELSDFDLSACSDFVREVVLPQLGQVPSRSMSRSELGSDLKQWMSDIRLLRERPVICFDSPVDLDLLWSLLNGRPSGWQIDRIDMRIDISIREQYFKEFGGRHHALHDARANRVAFR